MENQNSFWVVYLQVQIYFMIVAIAAIALFLILGGQHRNEILEKLGGKYITYRDNFAKVYTLVKNYVKVTLRTKINKYFGFVHIELKPRLVQHISFTLPSGNEYVIAFMKKRINRVLEVRDQESRNDVTQQFLKYLGPGHNFYGIPTRPEMLGMNNITITYVDNTEATFNKEDVISV
jgi:hypothetical protein